MDGAEQRPEPGDTGASAARAGGLALLRDHMPSQLPAPQTRHLHSISAQADGAVWPRASAEAPPGDHRARASPLPPQPVGTDAEGRGPGAREQPPKKRKKEEGRRPGLSTTAARAWRTQGAPSPPQAAPVSQGQGSSKATAKTAKSSERNPSGTTASPPPPAQPPAIPCYPTHLRCDGTAWASPRASRTPMKAPERLQRGERERRKDEEGEESEGGEETERITYSLERVGYARGPRQQARSQVRLLTKVPLEPPGPSISAHASPAPLHPNLEAFSLRPCCPATCRPKDLPPSFTPAPSLPLPQGQPRAATPEPKQLRSGRGLEEAPGWTRRRQVTQPGAPTRFLCVPEPPGRLTPPPASDSQHCGDAPRVPPLDLRKPRGLSGTWPQAPAPRRPHRRPRPRSEAAAGTRSETLCAACPVPQGGQPPRPSPNLLVLSGPGEEQERDRAPLAAPPPRQHRASSPGPN
ncbi:extensin-like [Suricata suricatta]|uniref:extensin-like n=1 Tax=Suricata suricatta TaxID=37032 RepID=UPI001156A8B9|nr:extensin-like [Suricata suricatta]